jgi:hypothetical protein
MTVETRYEHVVIDDNGVPLIAGTTTKVVELDRDIERRAQIVEGIRRKTKPAPLLARLKP